MKRGTRDHKSGEAQRVTGRLRLCSNNPERCEGGGRMADSTRLVRGPTGGVVRPMVLDQVGAWRGLEGRLRSVPSRSPTHPPYHPSAIPKASHLWKARCRAKKPLSLASAHEPLASAQFPAERGLIRRGAVAGVRAYTLRHVTLSR